MKDLYVKMTNTVDKIKEDLNKFIHMMYSWIKRLDIVKMSVSLKLVFRFKAIPVKISEFFFCVCVYRNRKGDSKMHKEMRRT